MGWGAGRAESRERIGASSGGARGGPETLERKRRRGAGPLRGPGPSRLRLPEPPGRGLRPRGRRSFAQARMRAGRPMPGRDRLRGAPPAGPRAREGAALPMQPRARGEAESPAGRGARGRHGRARRARRPLPSTAARRPRPRPRRAARARGCEREGAALPAGRAPAARRGSLRAPTHRSEQGSHCLQSQPYQPVSLPAATAGRRYSNAPSPDQSLPFGNRTSTPSNSTGLNRRILTPTMSIGPCLSVNDLAITKCVVVEQDRHECTSAAGSALSVRITDEVEPSTRTCDDKKYPHAPPDFRQRSQLQSCMNSGLASIVMLTTLHRQVAVIVFPFDAPSVALVTADICALLGPKANQKGSSVPPS